MVLETNKQCATFLDENIKNAAFKKFIFGADELTFRDVRGIGSIYKLIEVEYLLIYLKWCNSDREGLAHFTSERSRNIFKLLFSVYKTQKLDLDVMIYVLSEAQRDVVDLGEKSFFYGIVRSEPKCPFGKLYGLINDWAKSLQTAEDNIDIIVGYFADAILNADFLTETERDTADNAFVVRGVKLYCREVVYTDDNGVDYILTDRHSTPDGFLLDYVSLDGRAIKVEKSF